MLGVTAEALRANIDRKSAFLLERGQLGPKSQAEGIVSHHPLFVSENYDKRYFVRYKNVGTSFFRFFTMHAFDRQTDRRTYRETTDGRTERPSQYRELHYMQSHGKNEPKSGLVINNQPQIAVYCWNLVYWSTKGPPKWQYRQNPFLVNFNMADAPKLCQNHIPAPYSGSPATVTQRFGHTLRKYSLRHSVDAHPFPNCFRREKSPKLKIWPRFIDHSRFEAFWFRRRAIYIWNLKPICYARWLTYVTFNPKLVLLH